MAAGSENEEPLIIIRRLRRNGQAWVARCDAANGWEYAVCLFAEPSTDKVVLPKDDERLTVHLKYPTVGGWSLHFEVYNSKGLDQGASEDMPRQKWGVSGTFVRRSSWCKSCKEYDNPRQSQLAQLEAGKMDSFSQGSKLLGSILASRRCNVSFRRFCLNRP